MQCPRCQAENREGARFCRDCGALASTRDAEDAPDYYREALALAGELGMRPLVAHCHRDLGKLYAHTAERERALRGA